MRVSLIVLTYNWPEALALVLASAARQSRPPAEVIVADDGSQQITRTAIDGIAANYPLPLRHLWQKDLGFRVSRARNMGIAAASGDYIIVTDGDMVLHREFVRDHIDFARPQRFLAGGRLRATANETTRLLGGGKPCFWPWMDGQFDAPHDFRRKHALRLLWMARRKARSRRARIMGCNLSFWREDAVRINGFDEEMEGYGSEDLEFGKRLENNGVTRRQLKFAGLAVHLDHPSRAPVDPDDLSIPNNKIYQATRSGGRTRCDVGLDQHLGRAGATESAASDAGRPT